MPERVLCARITLNRTGRSGTAPKGEGLANPAVPERVRCARIIHKLVPFLLALATFAQETPKYTFGTTVSSSAGLDGKIYLLNRGTEVLPRFNPKVAAGSIYTTSLNVPPQSFLRGFPGITNRFEWFAIDYTGRFWIEHPGLYAFNLLSDDGAKLWINDRLLIDNDGTHPPLALTASARLSRGAYRLRVAYFQGPRHGVALVLSVRTPEQPWRVFRTDDFLPQHRSDEVWTPGRITAIKRAENW